MFIFSVKTNRKQIFTVAACVVALIIVILAAVFWPDSQSSSANANAFPGADDAQRLSYLSELGYQTTPEAVSVREVQLPEEFDDVLLSYNELQKHCGMDLLPYAGKRVKIWSYQITNIAQQGEIRANLYIYKNKIIAGDISSTAADGFMHGLIKNEDVMASLGTSPQVK